MKDWSHDISLPQYGPYNKQYVGFSHIASPARGLRLDIDLLPGFYRRSVMDTRSIADGGVRLWRARPDLQRFVYRYELLPPGKIYCEADFAQQGAEAALRCTFVNKTSRPQSLQADFCFSIRVPSFWRKPFPGVEISCPAGVRWIAAGDYKAQEGLEGIAHDGFRLGEEPEAGAYRGCAMRVKPGMRLTYRFDATESDSLMLRWRGEKGAAAEIMGTRYALPVGDALKPVCLTMPRNEYAEITLSFSGACGATDGFAIGLDAARVGIEPWPDAFVPEIEERPGEMTLRYSLTDASYTVRWDAPDYTLRELAGENDGDILTRSIHDHVSRRLTGPGRGHFTDLFVRPVFLGPHEEKTVTLLISAGGRPVHVPFPPLPECAVNPCGEKLAFSMERLTAATAMGVVYPAYYRGGFVRSYSPGRVWDSFYTWDCGMIAVGLTAVDRARAVECLRAYLMPQRDPHTPYLNHGTPLLTQMFAFKNLLDAGETETCRALYPALRYAYGFFLTLPRLGGLIATWQIFYNSGGWDDYPAQVYVHQRHMERDAAPVIVTSMMIIYGRILKNAARQLGFEEDLSAFDSAEKELAAAIARCWDEETGYFGYAMDDGAGRFRSILRDEAGVNPNQGLDGLYPLLAGLGSARQKRRMLANIREGLFTPIGVSVVDTRSPYFSRSGYWNGSVWMPHQWILWKALLDLGETALAHRIASTALNLWRRETGVSGNCYEHFMIVTGRGAGYHHFSGLSSPVLDWFRAYYRPGNVTAGFDTAVLRQQWNDDKTAVDMTVETHTNGSAVIVTLQEGLEYRFEGLPEGAKAARLHPGTYCLRLAQSGVYAVSARPVS